MAKNLRTRIPSNDTLIVHDRNEDATARFVDEMGNTGSGVEVAPSVRSVAERAVRPRSHTASTFSHLHSLPACMMNLFKFSRRK